MNEFRSSHDRMREWIKSPAGADLLEALGTSRSEQWHEPMAAALSKLIKYMHGQFPPMKDHNDQALRCAPIEAYMRGEEVPREQLTTAIVLLLQAFGGACGLCPFIRFRMWVFGQPSGYLGNNILDLP